MNKTSFKIETSKITQIYYGGDNECRCGCKGTYHEGEKTIQKVIKRIEKLDCGEITIADTYINISLPGNKAYTIYFNDEREYKKDDVDKILKKFAEYVDNKYQPHITGNSLAKESLAEFDYLQNLN